MIYFFLSNEYKHNTMHGSKVIKEKNTTEYYFIEPTDLSEIEKSVGLFVLYC